MHNGYNLRAKLPLELYDLISVNKDNALGGLELLRIEADVEQIALQIPCFLLHKQVPTW